MRGQYSLVPAECLGGYDASGARHGSKLCKAGNALMIDPDANLAELFEGNFEAR